jgi:gliding motility-associated lipoprotein GldH
MRKISTLLFVFVCVVGLSSCDFGVFNKWKIEGSKEFPNNTWNRFEPLEETFTISNLKKQYDVKVELSILDGFEYNQVPIEIVITSPSGQKNIVNKVMVIKDKDGNHIGKVEGDVWTVEQIIYSNKEFTEAGEYSVSVQNRTQYYELFKVKSVSFKISV